MTLPLVLPAMLAGALIAFLQALTMFGSPAILALPAGFHVITTKIWSLFQYPPKPHLAAAAAMPLLRRHDPAAARPETGCSGGAATPCSAARAARRDWSRSARWRWPALAFAGCVLSLTVILPYAALIKTALDAHRVRAADLGNADAAQLSISCSSSSRRPGSRMWNTFCSAVMTATARHRARAGRRPISSSRRLGRRHTAARLPGDRAGRDPRHRARRRAVPQLHAARRSCSTARCGSCCSPS